MQDDDVVDALLPSKTVEATPDARRTSSYEVTVDPIAKMLRSARRGSTMRRHVLERLQNKSFYDNDTGQRESLPSYGAKLALQQQRVPTGKETAGDTMDSRASTKGIRVAWTNESPPVAQEDHRPRERPFPSILNVKVSRGKKGQLKSPWARPKFLKKKARTRSRDDSEVANEQYGARSSERARRRHSRRMSQRRSSKSSAKELEDSTVKRVQTSFQKFYVPPLGPLDDPAGVIYLNGNLRDKTVDTGVLEDVGKQILKMRKVLFDIGAKRRSLVEDIRAHNRRRGSGFPRNPALEAAQGNQIEHIETTRRDAEEKLEKLVTHRRRLFDTLETSQAEEKPFLSAASIRGSERIAVDVDPDVASKKMEAQRAKDSDGLDGGDGSTKRQGRRSSLEDMKKLVLELMARESPPQNQAIRDAVTADGSRKQQPLAMEMSDLTPPLPRKSERRLLRKELNKGWRELFEAIFPEEAEKRRRVVDFERAGHTSHRERERTESNIRAFLSASSARDHLDFLIAAMDPSRAKDLPSAVKCVVVHYTGPAADELDLLLGARTTSNEAQALAEITLGALENVHVIYVPAVLLLQWLLARAPHLRALLLRKGILRKMMARLSGTEAKGREAEGQRAMQYSALALITGALFC